MFILWLFSIGWGWFVVPRLTTDFPPAVAQTIQFLISLDPLLPFWLPVRTVPTCFCPAAPLCFCSVLSLPCSFGELVSPASWLCLDCCSTIPIISKPARGQAFSLPYCLLPIKWWGWKDLAPVQALIPSLLKRSVLSELMDLTSGAVALLGNHTADWDEVGSC